MASKVRPLGDRVIVKPKPMTRSGIVLPDTASEKPQEGSVRSADLGACSRSASESRRE